MIVRRIGAANVQNKHASRDCVAGTACTHLSRQDETKAPGDKRDESCHVMKRTDDNGRRAKTVRNEPSKMYMGRRRWSDIGEKACELQGYSTTCFELDYLMNYELDTYAFNEKR